MRNKIKNQKGVSLIAAVFIIVILAFMGVIFLTLFTSGSSSSINDLQSAQALYLAEGGLEFILADPSDPNHQFPNYSMAVSAPVGPVNLGTGNFNVDTPASLQAAIGVGAVIFTVNTASPASFSAPGYIEIDLEIMYYTGWNSGTKQFTVTAANRGRGGTTAVGHAAGAAIYPVTTLSADPGIAPGPVTLTVANTTGFSIPGVIEIEGEYFSCTGFDATHFTGCTRGYRGTQIDSHKQAAGGPPATSGSFVYQFMLTATGKVGNAQRSVNLGLAASGSGITVDASSGSQCTFVGAPRNCNWSHTVSGRNLVLIVGVSITGTTPVTSVTYNGKLMTAVGVGQNSQANERRVEIWRLATPDLGNHTVSVTMSANCSIVAGAVSLTGVDQTTPIDASNFAKAGGAGNNAPTVSITTVTNNAWIVDA
jgi:Tfp pilus assembly protein PilX